MALASQRVYRKDNKHLTVDVYKFATPAQANVCFQERKAELAPSNDFSTSLMVVSESLGRLWPHLDLLSMPETGPLHALS